MADTLTITDNRTGKQYEVPIADGAVKAMDLRQIRTSDDDFGLMAYDPAFQNTASCKSRITFIDGDKGVLLYRGYPIEALAESSSFLDVAYLLLYGELPTGDARASWRTAITSERTPEGAEGILGGFRQDAHAMGMFVSMVGALSTYYPDAKQVLDADSRLAQIRRLIGQVPALGAWAYRHVHGKPLVPSD